MSSGRLPRRFALLAGGAALAGMAALSACGSTTSPEAPSTSHVPPWQSESPTSAPAASPTEKAVGPNGANSFSPTMTVAPPGATCQQVVGNTCIR